MQFFCHCVWGFCNVTTHKKAPRLKRSRTASVWYFRFHSQSVQILVSSPSIGIHLAEFLFHLMCFCKKLWEQPIEKHSTAFPFSHFAEKTWNFCRKNKASSVYWQPLLSTRSKNVTSTKREKLHPRNRWRNARRKKARQSNWKLPTNNLKLQSRKSEERRVNNICKIFITLAKLPLGRLPLTKTSKNTPKKAAKGSILWVFQKKADFSFWNYFFTSLFVLEYGTKTSTCPFQPVSSSTYSQVLKELGNCVRFKIWI